MKNVFHNIKLVIIYSLLMTLVIAEPVRIMPLGDSITYGDSHYDEDHGTPTGLRHAYRNHLWYMLQDAEYEADFVGSVIAGQDLEPPFDPENEGHPGWTSYDEAPRVYDWLLVNPADTILLHIGTNDHSYSVAGVKEMLDEIDRFERNTGMPVRVIVALIINRQQPDGVIYAFNENLKKLVNERINKGDILTLVDMYHKAALAPDDYIENTHPNDKGYQKIAKVWFDELIKPFNMELHKYPSSLVEGKYIQSVNFSEDETSVYFVAEVPDEGITF